jgi:hypothetical protein
VKAGLQKLALQVLDQIIQWSCGSSNKMVGVSIPKSFNTFPTQTSSSAAMEAAMYSAACMHKFTCYRQLSVHNQFAMHMLLESSGSWSRVMVDGDALLIASSTCYLNRCCRL